MSYEELRRYIRKHRNDEIITILKPYKLQNDIIGIFNGCRNCKEIQNLQLLDTSEVTVMTCMFSDCESLTSLNLSSFDTSKVEDMSGMFYYCKNLKRVELSSVLFNTSNVIDVSYMFNGCVELTDLDISVFDFYYIPTQTDMFKDCNKLKLDTSITGRMLLEMHEKQIDDMV